MQEKFIERGTEYQLEHGKLMVYETNCSCRDVKFYFEQNVLTIMRSGHKSILTDSLTFEFFPGTFYIPERECIHTVHIPNATFHNPTACLVLELDPNFLHQFHEEISISEGEGACLYNGPTEGDNKHFFSNDRAIIENFCRLYDHLRVNQSRSNQLIATLIIKELLLRVFQTEGLYLLRQNFGTRVREKSIQKSISYIKSHLQSKITVEQLARVSGLGMTTFYKKFKSSTDYSPIDFIQRERINLSKVMIAKRQYGLKEIAYRCGFNSYEYFCSSFKKLEQVKPSDFKKRQASTV